jgi:hypothetical protein
MDENKNRREKMKKKLWMAAVAALGMAGVTQAGVVIYREFDVLGTPTALY